MSRSVAGYNKNVFINCPFDETYWDMFMTMVFTVVECGFTPRCSLEASNSVQIRVQKIMQIIEDCSYGIHDISRTELDEINSLPRFNMPFELGIFVGCQRFGGDGHKDKCCIVLDTESHRYQKFLSDIAGQDIASHLGKKEILVEKIRNWLSMQLPGDDAIVPCGEAIFARYEAFQARLPELCQSLELRHNKLTFRDMIHVIKNWSQLSSSVKAAPARAIANRAVAKAAPTRVAATSAHSPKKAALAIRARAATSTRSAAKAAVVKPASTAVFTAKVAKRLKLKAKSIGFRQNPTTLPTA